MSLPRQQLTPLAAHMEMAPHQARAVEEVEAARVAGPLAALARAQAQAQPVEVEAARQMALPTHVLPRSPTNHLKMTLPREPLSQAQARARRKVAYLPHGRAEGLLRRRHRQDMRRTDRRTH